MENASGNWVLVDRERGREGVLFSTVYPFLDILNFVFYKKFKKEEIYSTQNIFLYYMLNGKYNRKMHLKDSMVRISDKGSVYSPYVYPRIYRNSYHSTTNTIQLRNEQRA